MSNSSLVILDSDEDSDVTLPPSDVELEEPASASAARRPVTDSPKQVLQKRKSLPYQFKKSMSSVHTISDSESDEEKQKKPMTSKVTTKLPEKHSITSNKSLLLISDSDDSPPKNQDSSKSSQCNPKPPQKQSFRSKKSLHLISDSGSDDSPPKKHNLDKSPQSNLKPALSSRQSISKKSLHLSSDIDSDDERKYKLASEKSSTSKLSSSSKKLSGDKFNRSFLSESKPNIGQSRNSGSSSAGKPLLSKQGSGNGIKDYSSKRPREQETSVASGSGGATPLCPYGDKCYRKNSEHRKEFRHKDDERTSPPPKKKPKVDILKMSVTEKYINSEPLNFFLTTVHGIGQEYNAKLAMGIKDILSPEMGSLEASVQFNYMTDIPWLVQQYPPQFRTKPLLIVHGEQRQGKATIDLAASRFSHIKLCQAKLEIMYGTHHTKMMLLLYKEGFRVVIHTSNLIQQDWHQKTQGIWISPLFPKLSIPSDKGESATNFKHDLLQYLGAYGSNKLTEWEKHIRDHDMSEARVFLIGSVPGRHREQKKSQFGHLKLRQVLQREGPLSKDVHQWPVVGQFSSIGSMGANKENWLCGEWLQSLAAGQGSSTGLGQPKLQLIYPSKDNVRLSLEGYPAGGSLPYSIKVAQKQTFLHSFFHVWKSGVRGRSRASPHIKTYSRMSPDGNELSWFLVTSANLSKAAWGALEKSGSQLMIRSYELGVLYIADLFGDKTFQIMKDQDDYFPGSSMFPVPYDLPPQPYTRQDKPWIWDIPYADLPDTNGNAWCPS